MACQKNHVQYSQCKQINVKSPQLKDREGDELHPMQRAFHENHGLQCGFCTPGMIMSAIELIEGNRDITNWMTRIGRQYLSLHRITISLKLSRQQQDHNNLSFIREFYLQGKKLY